MASKIELKPCPFCGSDNVEIYSPSINGKWVGYRSPVCNECHASIRGIKFKTKRQAAAAWNRRATDVM